MDANTKRIMHIRVKNTIKNLEANNMKAVYVETKEEALTLVKSIVEKGAYTAKQNAHRRWQTKKSVLPGDMSAFPPSWRLVYGFPSPPRSYPAR